MLLKYFHFYIYFFNFQELFLFTKYLFLIEPSSYIRDTSSVVSLRVLIIIFEDFFPLKSLHFLSVLFFTIQFLFLIFETFLKWLVVLAVHSYLRMRHQKAVRKLVEAG